jgi:hypothetical protein
LNSRDEVFSILKIYSKLNFGNSADTKCSAQTGKAS